jgi:hypothetical protein
MQIRTLDHNRNMTYLEAIQKTTSALQIEALISKHAGGPNPYRRNSKRLSMSSEDHMSPRQWMWKPNGEKQEVSHVSLLGASLEGIWEQGRDDAIATLKMHSYYSTVVTSAAYFEQLEIKGLSMMSPKTVGAIPGMTVDKEPEEGLEELLEVSARTLQASGDDLDTEGTQLCFQHLSL